MLEACLKEPCPMSLSTREMLARLIAFPSVSTSSNLDIIHFCRDWLQSHGVESHLVINPEGDKANLYATIGPSGGRNRSVRPHGCRTGGGQAGRAIPGR